MGRSPGDPPRRPPGVPVVAGATVLERLDLPADDELLELADAGVTTLEAAVRHDSPDLFADFLGFARRRVAALARREVSGAQVRSLPHALFADELSHAEVDGLESFLDRALGVLADRAADATPELGDAARRYLDHALAGRQDAAIAVVVDEARAGTDLGAVLTGVLEAAQRELGRLWEEGRLSVAQEHYCTAVTQLAMTALYPYLFARVAGPVRGRPRRRLVAVQAGGSLHQVGLRMVVDLLEHEGWDTNYLGAVSDPAQVIEALVQDKAQVLAISASMPAHVDGVAAFVRAVRADPRTATTRVVVGGRPFLVDPSLAAALGADGVARDARQAVAICAGLVEGTDVAV